VFKTGQLLLLLETYRIPCNRLVLPVKSEILTTFATADGVKPVMLKKYIKGHVVKDLDEIMLSQLGRQVALLNQIPSPSYLTTNHPYGRQFFPKVISMGIDVKYESWLVEELEYLDRYIPDNLPRGLIHGDLFYDNMLFDPSSNIPGGFKAIIDFEEACHYYLVFELGMCILGTCVNNSVVDFKKARSLVDGYQKVRLLVQKEKNSLQVFIRYAAAATSYWRFKKYNIEDPDEDKESHHWKMVQISKKFSEISKSHFYDAIFSSEQNISG